MTLRDFSYCRGGIEYARLKSFWEMNKAGSSATKVIARRPLKPFKMWQTNVITLMLAFKSLPPARLYNKKCRYQRRLLISR